ATAPALPPGPPPGGAWGGPLVLPLQSQSEVVGELHLCPRRQGDPWSPADLRLLDELARQVGVAVRAVRLTTDLLQARERLVTAREAGRGRLPPDLPASL